MACLQLEEKRKLVRNRKKRLVKSDFLKKSSWSFTAVLVRAVGGLTINKLFAVLLGAGGITLLSHFQNLTSLFTLLPSEGVNRGIMKYWSDPELSDAEKKKTFQSGIWVTTFIYLSTFALLFIWQRAYFFDRFIIDISVRDFLIVFIPAVFLMLLSGYLNSVILALRRVRAYALINITGLVVLVAVVYLGIQTDNLSQALLSFSVGYGLMFFFALVYLLRQRRHFPITIGLPDWRSFGRFGKFLAMAISAIVFGRLLDFAVRDYVIEIYGLERTGLWQAVAKMSTSYMLVFTGTVGVIYYPKMASLVHDHTALKKYVLRVMGFVAFITLMSLGIYYLNKEFFLKIFFDNGFERAGYLVRFQAIGDFFAILSYLLAYLLSARLETMKYIAAQLISAAVYVAMIYGFIDNYDLEALTMAYMWRYIAFFFILLLFNRRLLGR